MRKCALVTGGSRGIGFGIAVALAKEGYNLAINGVRSENDASDSLNELRKINSLDVIYCQGNIGEKSDREKIVSKTYDHFGAIDVLVNNAGIAPSVRKDILELEWKKYGSV